MCKICIVQHLVVNIFPWCNANFVPFPSGTLVACRMRNGRIVWWPCLYIRCSNSAFHLSLTTFKSHSEIDQDRLSIVHNCICLYNTPALFPFLLHYKISLCSTCEINIFIFTVSFNHKNSIKVQILMTEDDRKVKSQLNYSIKAHHTDYLLICNFFLLEEKITQKVHYFIIWDLVHICIFSLTHVFVCLHAKGLPLHFLCILYAYFHTMCVLKTYAYDTPYKNTILLSLQLS